MGLLARIKDRWRRTRSFWPDVELLEAGFLLRHSDNEVEILRWEHVSEIVTAKADLIATDEIYVLFFRKDDTCLRVPESSNGSHELREAMEQRFGIDPGWHWEVAMPPFAPNETILWSAVDKESRID